jgi:hypothetical protein
MYNSDSLCSSEGSLLRQWSKSSTESAADLSRLLVLGHENAVGTVEGHKLPLFLNHVPAQYLPRGTTRIHEEKLAVLFRYIGSAIHSDSPSRRAWVKRFCGAWPVADATFGTRATALAQIGHRMGRLALLTRKLPLAAQFSAAFDYHRPSCR